MLLFLLALIVAAAGVGAYARYNHGTQDITVSTYHLAGIPTWEVLAVAAGVPLALFLVQAIYANVRIRMLKRARDRYTTGRTFNDLPSAVEPQPAPKRSWTPSGD
jgi:hypothetical protein